MFTGNSLIGAAKDELAVKNGSIADGGQASRSGKTRRFRIGAFWNGKRLSDLFGLRTVNNVLAGGCVALTLFLAFDFRHQRTALAGRFKKIMSGEDGLPAGERKYPGLGVNLKESIALARMRNIFSFSSLGGGAVKPGAGSDKDLSQVLANLKLVGIFWSESNPQALIEDREEQKTILLSAGDYLAGIATVKQIYRDRVIIEAEGEEWELK